ncbi:hypothetical protein [Singulisphaera sp. Ch08]|uniref:hypothetical protein n=1 Tax=Singulisphaera sp. Ch08 TaxID=3120278 RepID=UPI0038738F54
MFLPNSSHRLDAQTPLQRRMIAGGRQLRGDLLVGFPGLRPPHDFVDQLLAFLHLRIGHDRQVQQGRRPVATFPDDPGLALVRGGAMQHDLINQRTQ